MRRAFPVASTVAVQPPDRAARALPIAEHQSKDRMSTDLPRDPDRPAPPPDHARFAQLSRQYAAAGRAREAALAQWAADLQVARPLLDRTATLLLATRATATEAASHREAVTAARGVALELVPDAARVQALFSSIQHLPDDAADHSSRRPREQAGVTVLLDQASDRMRSAWALEHTRPRDARLCARAADLASFEALLLESALTYGDRALVTVALRHDLAVAALESSDRAAAVDTESLVDSVTRTREVLRSIVEPHELEALEVALVPVVAS